MKSMTGMGRAEGTVLGMAVRLEIRSVNHRYCEVSTRLPSRYLPVEFDIQRVVKARLSRGKIDVFLFEEKRPGLAAAELEAFRSYHEYLSAVVKNLGLSQTVALADLLGGVNGWITKSVEAAELWQALAPLLQTALDDLEKMRKKEGDNLGRELMELKTHLCQFSQEIESKQDTVKKELSERLSRRIQEKCEDLKGLDEQRLHTEVLFYLDRMDITEELVRLTSHLEQLEKFLKTSEPIGRKLDFLSQEINREFNTIASKVQNSEISHLVVEAKAELEKMREQVQNIE